METLKQAIEARQKEAQRQPDDTLVWLIAGGMLLRARLAVVTEPYAYDQNCFFSWALKIAQDGPGNFYAPDYFADYPPGYMLVLGLVMGAVTAVTLRAILPALGRLGFNTENRRGPVRSEMGRTARRSR